MKRLVVFALLICSCLKALAQDWATVPNPAATEVKLRVGDRIPFTELHNMVNYPTKTMKLSDHKPKLIILDFWATSCAPCIKFWPTAMKLHKEFGKDLMIIPVNRYERAKLIQGFLAKRKNIDGFYMDLPMSCRDSTLWKNFPQSDLPSYVWISNGVVGSIAHGKDVNSENIKKWIHNGPFAIEQAADKVWFGVMPNRPIFVNGNGGARTDDAFVWTSSLTKGQDDIPADMYINYDSISGYGITVTSVPILHMYGCAYNNRLREWDYFDFLPISRIELIAKDTTKYWGNGASVRNKYNYQLIAGKATSRER